MAVRVPHADGVRPGLALFAHEDGEIHVVVGHRLRECDVPAAVQGGGPEFRVRPVLAHRVVFGVRAQRVDGELAVDLCAFRLLRCHVRRCLVRWCRVRGGGRRRRAGMCRAAACATGRGGNQQQAHAYHAAQ